MKLHYGLTLIIAFLFSASTVRADDIDYKWLADEGFGDVANALQSMPLEQRKAMLQQDGIEEGDVNNLSPEQLEQLHQQLGAMEDNGQYGQYPPAGEAVPDDAEARPAQGQQEQYPQEGAGGYVPNNETPAQGQYGQ